MTAGVTHANRAVKRRKSLIGQYGPALPATASVGTRLPSTPPKPYIASGGATPGGAVTRAPRPPKSPPTHAPNEQPAIASGTSPGARASRPPPNLAPPCSATP